jgi:hypothetical protein
MAQKEKERSNKVAKAQNAEAHSNKGTGLES